MSPRRRLTLPGLVALGVVATALTALLTIPATLGSGPETDRLMRAAAWPLLVVGALAVLAALVVAYRTAGPKGAQARPAGITSEADREGENRRHLLADLGHEVRTPLAALRGNLDTLVARGADLTEAQRAELLAAARSEVEQLAELVEELIEVASESGAEAEAVTVDLGDLAEQAAERYRRRTDRDILVVAIENGPPVTGRPAQLERAIGNLIDNAVKWGPPGAPVEVMVSSDSVSVRDHGPGIPPADLPRIFERLFRSPHHGDRPGSGLGLAIVEHIVSSHGGEVFASNHPEGGAVVGFRIPTREGRPGAPGPPS